MPKCPNCIAELNVKLSNNLETFNCRSCQGCYVRLDSLLETSSAEYASGLFDLVLGGNWIEKRSCPECRITMQELIVTHCCANFMVLDSCKECRGFWFDINELETCIGIAKRGYRFPGSLRFDFEASEGIFARLGRFEPKYIANDSYTEIDQNESIERNMLFALLNLPFKTSIDHTLPFPLLTRLFSVLIIIIFIYTLSAPSLIYNFGFIPVNLAWSNLAILITPFFLHGGIFHLLGNLSFLNVFGEDVEAYLGKFYFILLLMIGTVAACLFEYYKNPLSPIPMIGASGGISSILAFYALAFPNREIAIPFIGQISIYNSFNLNAGLAFVIWLAFQLIDLNYTGSNVSFGGHISAALAGFMFYEALHFRD